MQTEFFVELGPEADRLEIPWASEEAPANRYYDLKRQPELLNRVAEAQGNCPLRHFLESLNRPASLFATAKCDTWTTSEFSTQERAAFPAARAKFASYVDPVFAPAPLNLHPQHYEQLGRRLAQQLAPQPVPARAELCLRHCYYHAQRVWGFYLTIFLYGYGTKPDDAQQHWATGLAALARALDRISKMLQQAGPQSEPREPISTIAGSEVVLPYSPLIRGTAQEPPACPACGTSSRTASCITSPPSSRSPTPPAT